MGKNQHKAQRALNDLNYFETSGSVEVKPAEADALDEKSMDAAGDNMLKKKVRPTDAP